jgi:hypothetical protein
MRSISFKLLHGLVILRHSRRRLVSISVTSNPTAEWIAGPFPWDKALRPPIRDGDGTFGSAYTRRIRAMKISRSTYRTALDLAERPYREADRIDTSRISRPRYQVWRSPPARCPYASYYKRVRPRLSLTKMLRIFAERSRSAASQQYQSSAGSITNTCGFRF